MAKRQRHTTITEIVGTKRIRNQSELADALKRAGHRVTQPTLSRDIAELGLVKGPAGYSLPEQVEQPNISDAELRSTARRFILDAFVSNNLVMVKTFTGSASFVSYMLDRAGWDELVGTITGEDTILMMTRSNKSANHIGRQIKNLLGH